MTSVFLFANLQKGCEKAMHNFVKLLFWGNDAIK